MRSIDSDDFENDKKKRARLAENKQSAGSKSTARPGSEDYVQELFDYYRKRWEKKYGCVLQLPSYAAGKTLLKDVLRSANGDKLKVLHMVDIYLDDDRHFYRQQCKHSLEIFKKDMQQIAANASIPKVVAKAVAPLRIRTETLCPECGANFELECTIADVDKVVLVTACDKCKAKK